MRIISGKYKKMTIKGFNIDGTRPTMDRVKESMFAMIQNKLENAICLDLFAGSGSLGIEAISNGGKLCYFIDNGKEAYQILQENTQKLSKNEYQIWNLDDQTALKKMKEQKILFDVVFLDPPYHNHYINRVLAQLLEYQLLKKDAIVVCELEEEIIDVTGYEVWKEKKYGTKKVMILKKL